MIRPVALELALLATVAHSNACTNLSCELPYYPNLIVHVRAAGGAEVCDATVELFDRANKLVEEVPRKPGCVAYGIWRGQFFVRARLGARVSDTQPVDVDAGSCGEPLKKAEITLTLSP